MHENCPDYTVFVDRFYKSHFQSGSRYRAIGCSDNNNDACRSPQHGTSHACPYQSLTVSLSHPITLPAVALFLQNNS
jgi:hypothetical protein